jgi:hypothetical protein
MFFSSRLPFRQRELEVALASSEAVYSARAKGNLKQGCELLAKGRQSRTKALADPVDQRAHANSARCDSSVTLAAGLRLAPDF